MDECILRMKNITKVFPGVRALTDVSLDVSYNEVHALVGENGAGKSTLMNILSGVYPYGSYEGEIYIDGELCQFKDIKESEKKGVAIIHQELALIPYLSVAENVFLGHEIRKGIAVDWDETHRRAHELLKRVGYKRSITRKAKDISVGEQQLVEIAKALSTQVKLLILDEPTSALNEADASNLLELLLQLKAEGLTSIIISHKLNEVRRIADRITVIRDGVVIETLDKNDDTSEARIIKGMVGRDIPDIFPKRGNAIGEIMFEVRDWNVYSPEDESKKVLHDINLNVRKGEVIGISGLMGAGRTEFALSVFGRSYGKKIRGEVRKEGKVIDVSNVSKAIDNKIAYATEDRKMAGLILSEDIKDNIVLVDLKNISDKGIRNKDKEIKQAKKQVEALNVKCSGINHKAVNLSGGNQQKVVLGKWILSNPEVLILDEPTRGIDVGAKREVYQIVNNLACEGKSIILISSEMAELLGLCDRIYVMNAGRVVGELKRGEFSQEAILECIMASMTTMSEGGSK